MQDLVEFKVKDDEARNEAFIAIENSGWINRIMMLKMLQVLEAMNNPVGNQPLLPSREWVRERLLPNELPIFQHKNNEGHA